MFLPSASASRSFDAEGGNAIVVVTVVVLDFAGGVDGDDEDVDEDNPLRLDSYQRNSVHFL